MKFVFEPWMWWTIGTIVYVLLSIFTASLLIKVDCLDTEDPADNVLSGMVGLLWPMFIAFFTIIFPFWFIGKVASFISERIK